MNITAPGNSPVAETFATSNRSDKARLSSAANEFESLLLGQWLKDAESTLGNVPGSEEDDDAGGEQMKEFAMQHVATELTNHGGIGIASMVERALAKQKMASITKSGGEGLKS